MADVTHIDRLAPTTGLRDRLTRVGRGFGTVIRHLQYSQMCHALYMRSDAELEQMGMSRHDIPRIARELVGL